ncbi:MAG: hypothetical protein VYE73_10360 [Acidobacteriota bacterium]|nr:hypothetical protein [Acidobacteriota bacterium]
MEAAGLSTVILALVRDTAERLKPPRALCVPFPLGRPLGKPGDAAFQRSVLKAALRLTTAEEGPVLEDFPEEISDAAGEPLACPLPPRSRDDLPAAVDEALGLRAAYDRNLAAAGRTLVGRAYDADAIAEPIEGFLTIAEGGSWKELGLKGHPLQWSRDITSYYEEAAAALAGHVPEARAAESWFYQKTVTGKLLLDARATLKEAGEPYWFYLVPFTQDMELGRPG